MNEAVSDARMPAGSGDYLAAITESAVAGLITFDSHGRIAFANHFAARLFACEKRELIGLLVADLFDGPKGGSHRLLARLQTRNGPVQLDGESIQRRDGTLLPVRVSSSALAGRDSQWVLVVTHDTGTRGRIEELEREIERVEVMPRIQAALQEGTLLLVAQPIVALATGEVSHHELLIRMRSSEGVLVPPSMLLPVAEEQGMINEVDRWVIHQGVTLASHGNSVAMNLSAATLADPDLGCWVERLISNTGTDPARILFEVTETALLADTTRGRHLAHRLAGLGCRMVLDDFGSGYGGFTYLKHLDLAMLKIDIEFVHDLPTNQASRHVVHAIVSLAQAFGLETIAEGVENPEALRVLEHFGVDYAQGFYWGRPGPLDEHLMIPRLECAAEEDQVP